VLRLAAPLLWILYVIVPVDGWGFLQGRPLGLWSTLAVAAICWSAYVVSGFSRTK